MDVVSTGAWLHEDVILSFTTHNTLSVTGGTLMLDCLALSVTLITGGLDLLEHPWRQLSLDDPDSTPVTRATRMGLVVLRACSRTGPTEVLHLHGELERLTEIEVLQRDIHRHFGI